MLMGAVNIVDDYADLSRSLNFLANPPAYFGRIQTLDDLSVHTYVRAYVRTCVRPSVCPVHCGKTADRIRMPFGIIDRTGLVWGSVHGKGYFWGEFGARHCNQWGLYGVRVQQCREAAVFPNYFGQTCFVLLLEI